MIKIYKKFNSFQGSTILIKFFLNASNFYLNDLMYSKLVYKWLKQHFNQFFLFVLLIFLFTM